MLKIIKIKRRKPGTNLPFGYFVSLENQTSWLCFQSCWRLSTHPTQSYTHTGLNMNALISCLPLLLSPPPLCTQTQTHTHALCKNSYALSLQRCLLPLYLAQSTERFPRLPFNYLASYLLIMSMQGHTKCCSNIFALPHKHWMSPSATAPLRFWSHVPPSSGSMSINIHQQSRGGGGGRWSVAFADFRGIYFPTSANCKLPKWYQWMQSWGEMVSSSRTDVAFP